MVCVVGKAGGVAARSLFKKRSLLVERRRPRHGRPPRHGSNRQNVTDVTAETDTFVF